VKKLLLVLCLGVLVACGETDKPASNGGDTAATAAPDAPAATAAPAAPAAQALPPYMAAIKGEAFDGDVPVNMKVGETYVFTGDSKGWQVDTINPELVEVKQGGTQDTYETNPGFVALAAGKAVVTVTSPANTILTIMVTIE
jgi:hypothetical protein